MSGALMKEKCDAIPLTVFMQAYLEGLSLLTRNQLRLVDETCGICETTVSAK